MPSTNTKRMTQIAHDLADDGFYTAGASVDAITTERDVLLRQLELSTETLIELSKLQRDMINRIRDKHASEQFGELFENTETNHEVLDNPGFDEGI